MLWLSRLPGMSAALSGVSCLQLVGGTFLEHPMNGIFDELYGYHVHLAWCYNISSVIILLLLGLVNMVIHIGYLEFVRRAFWESPTSGVFYHVFLYEHRVTQILFEKHYGNLQRMMCVPPFIIYGT